MGSSSILTKNVPIQREPPILIDISLNIGVVGRPDFLARRDRQELNAK
jgi:hypothetical protein